ncbi:hypothetical protein PFISCL1PPCAC_13338 [Pristionchus fissidentatus]|uniref:F-box associated domain-containing protein n=1 Tax=Pristionchus fissidentatus TaxID=1538716 RepID=A0AAV5VU32_9BILA|nr:hypothetical protein PFISCL1PPCAC_13338 [Pristionchus fissidentatus]
MIATRINRSECADLSRLLEYWAFPDSGTFVCSVGSHYDLSDPSKIVPLELSDGPLRYNFPLFPSKIDGFPYAHSMTNFVAVRGYAIGFSEGKLWALDLAKRTWSLFPVIEPSPPDNQNKQRTTTRHDRVALGRDGIITLIQYISTPSSARFIDIHYKMEKPSRGLSRLFNMLRAQPSPVAATTGDNNGNVYIPPDDLASTTPDNAATVYLTPNARASNEAPIVPTRDFIGQYLFRGLVAPNQQCRNLSVMHRPRQLWKRPRTTSVLEYHRQSTRCPSSSSGLQ